jgi:hypothetical protein
MLCLEVAGLDGIRSAATVFLFDFGFRGSAAKLCWLLPSCDTISHSMVKSASIECHGSRVLGTSNGGLSLCGKEELAL